MPLVLSVVSLTTIFYSMQIISELSSGSHNETYHGLILTLQDALLVLEATRLNILPKVKRRLDDVERKLINAGSVFAWNETECGMKRWTDGRNWLASKVKGPFLTYQEQDSARNVKPNGLVKQSFSLATKQNEKFHLIAYYDPLERAKGVNKGKVPSQDSLFNKLLFDPNVYLNDILYHNNPDSRSATLPPPQLTLQHLAAPTMQYPVQPPVERHNSYLVYHPVQTPYYCHPSMMGYHYVSQNALPLPQPYLIPQQPVYIQQIAPGHHSYPYQEAPRTSYASLERPMVPHYTHQLPVQVNIRQPPTSSPYSGSAPSLGPAPNATKGYFNYEHNPAFTYGLRRVDSLLSIPSPNLPNSVNQQSVHALSEPIPKQDSSPAVPARLRLPSAYELLLPVGLAPIPGIETINKLNEPKVFSV